jgi:cell division protein ZapA (FtsZ GTPase activity inhibitor)
MKKNYTVTINLEEYDELRKIKAEIDKRVEELDRRMNDIRIKPCALVIESSTIRTSTNCLSCNERYTFYGNDAFVEIAKALDKKSKECEELLGKQFNTNDFFQYLKTDWRGRELYIKR